MLHGEQTAALDHRVGDHPRHLVEHQPLDGAELLVVATVDGRSLHAVAGNQAVRHGDLRAVGYVKF
jgi:hypothetical protein